MPWDRGPRRSKATEDRVAGRSALCRRREDRQGSRDRDHDFRGIMRSELPMHAKAPATYDDLARVEGKAELINGEIVHMPPTGDGPGTAGDEIFVSLREYARRTGTGHAVCDNKAFE